MRDAKMHAVSVPTSLPTSEVSLRRETRWDCCTYLMYTMRFTLYVYVCIIYAYTGCVCSRVKLASRVWPTITIIPVGWFATVSASLDFMGVSRSRNSHQFAKYSMVSYIHWSVLFVMGVGFGKVGQVCGEIRDCVYVWIFCKSSTYIRMHHMQLNDFDWTSFRICSFVFM